VVLHESEWKINFDGKHYRLWTLPRSMRSKANPPKVKSVHSPLVANIWDFHAQRRRQINLMILFIH
jgi:hypothetical protein